MVMRICVLGCLTIMAGCSTAQLQSASTLDQAIAPIAKLAIASASPPAGAALSLVAQTACAVQSNANANNQSEVSTVAGLFCAW